ncbi:VOC family protein [Acidovorax sp. NCPPB 4044]|uniref:VOC family protein n=1 Tax=Acidovorax sp. NCPPB 4044 TaxID=2940490 RepID=UPI002304A614|nr:VOC family protein [Acidovorax sp. NCPPB 4044]MDA8523079.1 VOC family protein [Acidovorax sp. NCPPB 4044]
MTPATSHAPDTAAATAAAAVRAINWFEIPCADLGRAQAFYERVLGRPMRREDFGGDPMAVFARGDGSTGGCLAAGPTRRAAGDGGVRIYLDCEPGLGAAVARVAPAGGEVIDACIELPHGIGFIAHLRDTEGNTIGLHAAGR